jgi:general secretion pathway protein I
MMTNRARMIAKGRADVVVSVVGISWHRSRYVAVVYRGLQRKLRRLMSHARREGGFALVEVIVALAILSIGLGTLLGLISNSLRQAANAERMAEAGSLAQSLMAGVGTELPIKPEQRGGQFPNGYRWHLKMLPYGDVKEREEWPVGVYTVSTEVEWDEGAQRRSFALTTLRLGPKAVRQ